MYDVVIQNGTVVDGTGESAYKADVAISGGKILRIAPGIDAPAAKRINASGRIVTPGFIDNHSHSDYFFLFGTDGYNYIEQGITTECAGMCGLHPAPVHAATFDALKGMVDETQIESVLPMCKDYQMFMDAVSRMELPTNMGFYAGHGDLRARVAGHSSGRLTELQLEAMKEYLRQAMEYGYMGMSTGLIYPPSVFGDEDEITQLCKVVAAYQGTYCSHIRGESDNVMSATAEAIRIGERTGCQVQISHMKVAGRRNLGKSRSTLEMMEQARSRGVNVSADQYPFAGCAIPLISAIPPQFAKEGQRTLAARLSDRTFRREIADSILANKFRFGENFVLNGGFGGMLVLSAPQTPEYEGRTIEEYGVLTQTEPFDAYFNLIERNGAAAFGAVFMINEEDMMNIIAHPLVVVGTDCCHCIRHYDTEATGSCHPRGVSTFPRHLRIVRENKLFSMEKAIYRITGMSAEIARLPGVGYLKPNYCADICVIDWNRIGETNDFSHPFRPNTGIDYVLINGKVVAEQGVANGLRAGVLKRRVRT